jgi:hypothetical protein
MEELVAHPSAAVYYTAPVLVPQIRLAGVREIALLVIVAVGSHQSREAQVEELFRTHQSVVIDYSPIAEDAVPNDLVIVVCHVFHSLGGNWPQSVRHDFVAVVDCFGWGSCFVLNSLLEVEPDCSNRQLDCIDRRADQNLDWESLKICQRKTNKRHNTQLTTCGWTTLRWRKAVRHISATESQPKKLSNQHSQGRETKLDVKCFVREYCDESISFKAEGVI